MQNSRQQILKYLRDHKMASAGEISRDLHMTAANARHHFSVLASQGLIEEIGLRPSKSRGRPTKLFRLPPEVLDNNINQLASALLKSFLGDGDLDTKFTDIITCLFGEPPPDALKTTMLQRLNQTIQELNHANYQARWEASPEGPRLILGHCPYAAILSDHPELCLMDRIFLSRQLEQSVEQIAKLERDPKGAPSCIFLAQQ
ncbi:MAG: helix-turn-helix domain-containing protein [Chloroflexota bacterium]